MIISRTPLRISFVGGGTDLPAFYTREHGAVVTTAIDKYIYIAVNKKFDQRIRASYSITEIVDSIDELKHELIREAMKCVGIENGIEIVSISDIPSEGTGLGSSSAYLVGLLNALHAYRGHHATPERLAREACEIEINILGKPIGKQDQYITAYGGLRFLQFDSNGTVYTDPVRCSDETKQTLQDCLFLFYTGITRSANKILYEQQSNSVHKLETQQSLRRLAVLARMMSINIDDLYRFGDILHAGWIEKQKLASTISSPRINQWYETACSHGALGGKLLGAGGGGFMLFYAPIERHQEIIAALSELRHVPFRFESEGSKIIFNWGEKYNNLIRIP